MAPGASRTYRTQLVAELERRGLIRTEQVRTAFAAVPRELFVPDFAAREGLAAVYRDQAIVTKRNEHGTPLSSSSQPAIMARMLEELELQPGMRVLEIGAGTGYNAALLSLLVGTRGRVVSVDVDRRTAAEARRALRVGGYRVRVVHGDGRAGFAPSAPYDRIIVTASADAVPLAWFEQLAGNGLLEVPLRLGRTGTQAIPVLRKTSRGFRSQRVVCGGFMPLRDPGEAGATPYPEPCLTVSEVGGSRPEPLLQLSGAGLATLSPAAKRRLVATALGRPRTRRLGTGARLGFLGLYLSVTLPRRRLTRAFPGFCIGLLGRDGRSLALLDLGGAESATAAVHAYGGAEAEELLLDRVREWEARGRPGESDLDLTVSYAGTGSRIAIRWPARQRSLASRDQISVSSRSPSLT